LCLIQTPPPHPILHSFPTRRSSDLFLVLLVGTQKKGAQRWLTIPGIAQFQPAELAKVAVPAMVAWYFHERQLPARLRDVCLALRSEEHTSELQSRFDLVCRLLLDKK